MTANPYFSVVTPVRNGMPYIKRCVASVWQQGNISKEHLIQDAVSTDGTLDWCSELSNVQLVSEADEGMYDAINRGWGRANGLYLSWLNADEQYLPGTLNLVSRAFQCNPKIDAIFGDAIIIDPNGAPLAYRREPALRAWYIKNSFLYAYSCTLFFRRTLWDQGILRLDPTLKYAADMDLVLRLLNQNTRFLNLRRPLALFTASGQNLSTHVGMSQETQLIYSRYQGFKSPILRAMTRFPRWIEKAMVGGFALQRGSYKFLVDDKVPGQQIPYRHLGTMYTVFQDAP